MSKPDREAMLARGHPELSVRRQCRLLSLSRSGAYRRKAVDEAAKMRSMMRYDYRRIHVLLRREVAGERQGRPPALSAGGPLNAILNRHGAG